MQITSPIGLEQARAALALDWPDALTSPAALLDGQLTWLPFHNVSARPLFDAATHGLPPLRLTRAFICKAAERSGSSRTPAPRIDAPPDQEPIAVYVPFWLFGEDRDRPSAAVEAIEGMQIVGSLPARRSASLLRLGVLTALALFPVFFATHLLQGAIGFLFQLTRAAQMQEGRVLPLLPWLSIPLVAWTLWRLWHFARPACALREPLLRAVSGRVSWPVDEGWKNLLRVSGWISLLYALFNLAQLARMVQQPGALLPFAVTMVILYSWIGLLALKLGKRSILAAPSAAGTALPHSPIVDVVQTVVRLSFFAVGGMLAGQLVVFAGFKGDIPAYQVKLLVHGVNVGVVLAILSARITWSARLAITVGMVAEAMGELLLGVWGGLGLCLVALPLALLPHLRRQRREGSDRSLALSALRRTIVFNLGAVIGRIAGRILGVVLLGGVGLAVGEVVGERLAGTVAFLLGEPDDETAGPP